MNLNDIQVGDLIAIPAYNNKSWDNTPHVSHQIYCVTRRTAHQAEAVERGGSYTIRIRTADAKVIGRSYVNAVRATPDLLAKIDAQADLRRRHLAAESKLRDLEGQPFYRLKLTIAQLEALAEAWERIKAMERAATAFKADDIELPF